MFTNILRTAAAAAAAAPLLLLATAPAHAATGPTALPDSVHPVVMIGQQHSDPIAAFLACAPTGLIPVFGPNIVLPICVA